MTNEKALKDLKRQVELWGKGTDFAYSLPPLKIAIKALEKQIPKKPFQACGHATYSTMNYCPICGQALDWSDTGENI